MKIYVVPQLAADSDQMITELGQLNRMLSFASIGRNKGNFLEFYAKNGYPKSKKRKIKKVEEISE